MLICAFGSSVSVLGCGCTCGARHAFLRRKKQARERQCCVCIRACLCSAMVSAFGSSPSAFGPLPFQQPTQSESQARMNMNANMAQHFMQQAMQHATNKPTHLYAQQQAQMWAQQVAAMAQAASAQMPTVAPAQPGAGGQGSGSTGTPSFH